MNIEQYAQSLKSKEWKEMSNRWEAHTIETLK